MLVSELLAAIKLETGYITNSLIEKSHDTHGGTYKYLVRFPAVNATHSYRKEIFIAAEGTENDNFGERTVIESVEVREAK
jgi:hypothetical protein